MRATAPLLLALLVGCASGAPHEAPARTATPDRPTVPTLPEADAEAFVDVVNTFLRARSLSTYRGVLLPFDDATGAFSQHLSSVRLPGARTTLIECHRQNGWCLLTARISSFDTVDEAAERFEEIVGWLDSAPLAGGPYVPYEDDLLAPARVSIGLRAQGRDKTRLSVTLSTLGERPSVSLTIHEP